MDAEAYSMRIAVNGATGFVGSHLVRHLSEAGHQVTALSRAPDARLTSVLRLRWLQHELSQPLPVELFSPPAPPDVFIHCAFASDPLNPRRAEELNVRAARSLLDDCRVHRVRRFVFISSMSALEIAESGYGRSKWRIENMLDPARDLIIRPGLVIGAGGLFASMVAAATRTPVLPLFYGGGQRLQTISIDDLVDGILKALELDLTGDVVIAEAEPIAIGDFYAELACAVGRRPILLPLPGAPVYWSLRMLERLGMKLPVTSESLLGLKHMTVTEAQPDLQRLGLTPGDWKTSIARYAEEARSATQRP
jgi:nucleoside-diphosphate-sugar epimerase